MSEMIERVAKAIHHYRPNRVEPWERCVESYKKELRMQAKAAIEAMREPTNKMVKPYIDAYYRDEDMKTAWREMIDAALKE